MHVVVVTAMSHSMRTDNRKLMSTSFKHVQVEVMEDVQHMFKQNDSRALRYIQTCKKKKRIPPRICSLPFLQLGLRLFLLQHGVRDISPLNLAGGCLGHDIREEDLLGQLEFRNAIFEPVLQLICR